MAKKSGDVPTAAQKLMDAVAACLSRSTFDETQQLDILKLTLVGLQSMSKTLQRLHGPTDDELLAEPDEREDEDENDEDDEEDEDEDEDGEDDGTLDDEEDDA